MLQNVAFEHAQFQLSNQIACISTSLLKDFLVSSYANALDDKHFFNNAGDAIRGRCETKYRENEK